MQLLGWGPRPECLGGAGPPPSRLCPIQGARWRQLHGARADSQPGLQAVSCPRACPPASVQRLVSLECFLPKVWSQIRSRAFPTRRRGGPSASGSLFHRPEATPFQLVQRGCDPAGEVLQSSPLLGLYSLGIMSGSYLSASRFLVVSLVFPVGPTEIRCGDKVGCQYGLWCSTPANTQSAVFPLC